VNLVSSLPHCASRNLATSSLRPVEQDLSLLAQAAKLSQTSVGLTQPHPNAACIIADSSGRVVSSAHLRAQGTTSAEVLAAREAGEAARGATAYLNLESGDCHGDDSAVSALIQAGVSRVVLGLKHPLGHLR
jgi:diaminohydroxyphosphoribosylaminopyrimidine deaminase/5-amino-6-(5-phosphoribosylamino)uracil reductase